MISLMAAGAVYAYSITDDLVMRFEGKRWKVPSRVYSDSLTLLPGDSIASVGLVDRLTRLQYQPIESGRPQAGEYRQGPNELVIHLRDFDYPWEPVKGYAFRLTLKDGVIRGIENFDTGDELPAVEIEPELIARFFGEFQEDRDIVRYVEVSPHLRNAIVTVEDKRFYRHHGIDPFGFARAMVKNLIARKVVQGGSTITQQLVKNFFLSAERTYARKAKEAVMAIVLEMIYDKDAIFEAYLNEVYFAQEGPVSISGVGQASRHYFGRDVRSLGLAESALLAGLIRSPASYNPNTQMERARARRDLIVRRMFESDLITRGQAEEALARDVRVLKRKPTRTIAPYFIDFLRRQLEARYGPDILIGEGLSIFTTLDVNTQRNAEAALTEGLSQLEADFPNLYKEGGPQGAIVVTQPQTGFIRAMVGGRDYYESQYNRAVQSRRQVGSVFKPFVYTAGFLRAAEDPAFAFTPATVVEDEPYTVEQAGSPNWTPQNYDRQYRGSVTIRDALVHSMNVPTARLAMEVGIDRVASLAYKMGITTPMPEFPALSLGSADLSPLEVANAYSTLANQGTWAAPLSIRDIVDARGEVLEKKPVELRNVMPAEVAYLTTSVMQDVINRGTAQRARGMGFTHPAAGKTGTTDDHKDAWFVGYTPRLLAAVWVGFDEDRNVGLAGSRAALPIWTRFMQAQLAGSEPTPFEEPAGIVHRDVCTESGKLAIYDCPAVRNEVFVKGTEPGEECEIHQDSLIEKFLKLGSGEKET
ncbi:PBP1A family penicillin-binding protein [bacterium]|nr:PBP1A family penicillin-binding protein [bacterium]